MRLQPMTDADVFTELGRRGLARVTVAFTTTDGARTVRDMAFAHPRGPAAIEPDPGLRAAGAGTADSAGKPIAAGTLVVSTTHEPPRVRRAAPEDIARGRLYAALTAPVDTTEHPAGTLTWDAAAATRTFTAPA